MRLFIMALAAVVFGTMTAGASPTVVHGATATLQGWAPYEVDREAGALLSVERGDDGAVVR
ncbi:MAG: hypothetical protein H0T41_05695, partial [Rhodobacteraceae bacterium]|nr:hypothetical protein [Paracoccaceae bacterium]